MSKSFPKFQARIIQDATGARYMTCRALVLSLSENDPSGTILEAYLDDIERLPDLKTGQERCLTCLRDKHAGSCKLGKWKEGKNQ